MENEKSYRIAIDECTNDKLRILQELYKEKHGKFIPLGKLISRIIMIPNFIQELTR